MIELSRNIGRYNLAFWLCVFSYCLSAQQLSIKYDASGNRMYAVEKTALATIDANPDSVKVEYPAGNSYFTVMNLGGADLNWQAIPASAWLTITGKSAGVNYDTVFFTHTANPVKKGRVGTINLVDDAAGNSPFAVQVTQQALPNNPPILVDSLTSFVTNQDFVEYSLDLSSFFSDPDGDTLTYMVQTYTDTVVTAVVMGTNLMIGEIQTGQAFIDITADDGYGGTTTAQFALEVRFTGNNAPVVVTPLEDKTYGRYFKQDEISLLGVFKDPDGEGLSLRATSSDETVMSVEVIGAGLYLIKNNYGQAEIIVRAQDPHGAWVEDAFTAIVDMDLVTGTEEELTFYTDIYPNPADRYLQISSNRFESEVAVSLFNTSGLLLYQGKYKDLTAASINVSGLAKGVYMLHLVSAERAEVHKVMVE
ncbi:MAG: T9SS type A sorting domain-containing protein [Cyclobacteriaceae bacterium]|nr:T9SS type A sorting domain-containing protein [Cyclobacteriaceae bacterium]